MQSYPHACGSHRQSKAKAETQEKQGLRQMCAKRNCQSTRNQQQITTDQTGKDPFGHQQSAKGGSGELSREEDAGGGIFHVPSCRKSRKQTA
jgi:hypothetical protein